MINTYDDENIFNSFLKERKDINTPYNLQVKPKMLDLIGNIVNKSILDIGCGFGSFAKELSILGAKFVMGIDISERLIEYLKNGNCIILPTGINYIEDKYGQWLAEFNKGG